MSRPIMESVNLFYFLFFLFLKKNKKKPHQHLINNPLLPFQEHHYLDLLQKVKIIILQLCYLVFIIGFVKINTQILINRQCVHRDHTYAHYRFYSRILNLDSIQSFLKHLCQHGMLLFFFHLIALFYLFFILDWGGGFFFFTENVHL